MTSADLLIRTVTTNVDRLGYTGIPVGYGGCSTPGCRCTMSSERWAYTIGFHDQGRPELLVAGLTPGQVSVAFRTIDYLWHSGENVGAGSIIDIGSHTLRLEAVPAEWLLHDASRMALWLRHYAHDRTLPALPQLLQVLWSDDNGRFPDQSGYDHTYLQPILAVDPTVYPRRSSRSTRRNRRSR